MKILILIFVCSMLIHCQVVYTKSGAGSVKDDYLYRDILGSWKNKEKNLYITFNNFDEYIASVYVSNRSSYGHLIKSSGYYEITNDTLILEDDKSGFVSFYILHFFDDHTWIDPINIYSSNSFQGGWLLVPTIDEYGIVYRPIRPDPINPRPPIYDPSLPPAQEEPVVKKDDSDNHKKRPDVPKIERPKRPERPEQPEKKLPVKKKTRSITL